MTHVDPQTIEPFGIQFDLIDGVMCKPEKHIIRNAAEMVGYYADDAALRRLIASHGNPIHYETFESPVPEQRGHVRFCISKLHPGLVGEECFMTKGHYHKLPDTAEIYLCLRGRGLMMMKLADGNCQWQEFLPGRLVYVPPYWAHRSVNTGDEPLISLCIYPGDAGHDYGNIQSDGFPKRVFRRNGHVLVE
ncbi:MAG: glucose-6-phosphate isomerase [Planctomycetes bacterium]|nr:glucose-6-phosphate isomerase [Planctomycetota bacterium]